MDRRKDRTIRATAKASLIGGFGGNPTDNKRKGYTMTLEQAKQHAQQQSAIHQCGQHVNYNAPGNYYYVSDWYDCDSTVATYSFGKEK